jgi:hypothetical protein
MRRRFQKDTQWRAGRIARFEKALHAPVFHDFAGSIAGIGALACGCVWNGAEALRAPR